MGVLSISVSHVNTHNKHDIVLNVFVDITIKTVAIIATGFQIPISSRNRNGHEPLALSSHNL